MVDPSKRGLASRRTTGGRWSRPLRRDRAARAMKRQPGCLGTIVVSPLDDDGDAHGLVLAGLLDLAAPDKGAPWDVARIAGARGEESRLGLDELVREGARRMIAVAPADRASRRDECPRLLGF